MMILSQQMLWNAGGNNNNNNTPNETEQTHTARKRLLDSPTTNNGIPVTKRCMSQR